MVAAADGSAFTGSVTVAVTLDAGTQATGTVGSGACTHEGNGYHTYAPSQAESNGDLVAFTFTGSGAVPQTVQIYTRPYKHDAWLAAGAELVIGSGSTSTSVKLSTVDGASASTTNDFYNGRVIVFTSGTLSRQAAVITDYVGSTATATVPTMTGAPSNTDTAMLV